LIDIVLYLRIKIKGLKWNVKFHIRFLNKSP